MSTAVTVRFDEPAHDALRADSSRRLFAGALRARPGVWALLGKFVSSGAARQHAYEIRNALEPKDRPFAPAGAFEADARTVCGEYRVYVRYVGGDQR